MYDIESAIRAYITQNILFSANGYPYPDDVSLLAEGIVDSTNVLELVLFVEEAFGINVADHEIEPANFDSVSRLAAFVRSKLPITT